MDTARIMSCVTCVIMAAVSDARFTGNRLEFAQRDATGCTYKNLTYPSGEHFRPDQCTTCHCPKSGGRPNCVIEDCRIEQDCVKYAPAVQPSCCQICVERGCRDVTGAVYRPGELVSVTSCTECHCPPEGGRIVCGHMKCPEVSCVDAVTSPGTCCPACPNGDNCWLGKEVLPVGQKVHVGRCKTCLCPTDDMHEWAGRRAKMAVCVVQC